MHTRRRHAYIGGECAVKQEHSPPSVQVQDMMDPEYYVGAVRGADGAWTTTKYCDAAISALVTERDMQVLFPH